MRQYLSDIKSPFHIYNRGVDKRVTFNVHPEYCRFLLLMWISRIGRPSPHITRERTVKAVVEKILHGEEPEAIIFEKEHDPLVGFVSWTLMPIHFHFLLVSLVDGGISKFMQKLSNAYTKYFNALHERSGSLFQGPFQSIEVKDEEYLNHLSRYIHLNPTELVEANWKKEGIKNWKNMQKHLKTYPWSSYPDFIGKRNSLLVDRKLVSELLNVSFDEIGAREYQKFVNQWLPKDPGFIVNYTLE